MLCVLYIGKFVVLCFINKIVNANQTYKYKLFLSSLLCVYVICAEANYSLLPADRWLHKQVYFCVF